MRFLEKTPMSDGSWPGALRGEGQKRHLDGLYNDFMCPNERMIFGQNYGAFLSDEKRRIAGNSTR